MEVDLTAVATFLAVVEHQHFGRAAAVLGVSVSAVTKRLHRLEAALGVPLVERDSGGFTGLTPAGRRYVQVAPLLLQAERDARLLATGGSTTTLRIAVPAGVGVVAPLLPAALSTLEVALRHAHPGVGVAAVPTPFASLTPDLLAGRVDVVLTFGGSPEEGVHVTRLSDVRRVGMVAASHPFAHRGVVDVEEFARQPMVFGRGLPEEYMHPFVLADVRPLAEADLVGLDASNTAHVAQRVLLGREVTVVPLALTANLPQQLRRVSLRGVPPAWYTAHRRADDHRPELLTAVDLMADFTESLTLAALRT